VQHFPTAHIDDLEERVNQLMAARRANTQPPYNHAPHQSCSYCYHLSHQIDDCSFFNHYIIETSKFAHEHAQTTTILVSEEKAIRKEEEKEEQVEHIEPTNNPNVFNDKEVSTKAHSLINFPLEMHNEKLIVTREEIIGSFWEIGIMRGWENIFELHAKPNFCKSIPKRFQVKEWSLEEIREVLKLGEGYILLKKRGWK
jgi:hypothetical protein